MFEFPLGLLLATPAALEAAQAAGDDIVTFVHRHAAGDRGAVSPGDDRLNDQALLEGSRLLSANELTDGTRIWIITVVDRPATTVLLPAEY